MKAVTPTPKRYVVLCAGCDLLFDTSRRDAMTCSPACRVRFHRNPKRREWLRREADAAGLHPAGILQGAASDTLCPALVTAVLSHTCSIADLEAAVWRAYQTRVRAAQAAYAAEVTRCTA